MAFHVQYSGETFRPVNDQIPDNETSDNPVEFDIVPAWGPDLARVKSIVYAAAGLVQDKDWTPETQRAVIAAFETGAPAFLNTVTAIRGLTVPAAMALRAGVIDTLPIKAETGQPDRTAAVAIQNGRSFMRIVGALPAMGLHVAARIAALSNQAEQDPRLFKQPSGSGTPETASQAAGTTVAAARRRSRRRGTAARPSTKPGSRPTGPADDSDRTT